MKRRNVVLTALILGLAAGPGAWGQGKAGRDDMPNAKAAEAHNRMRGMPPGVASTLGFASEAQIEASKVGDPHRVYAIELDDLKGYKRGEDPRRIVRRTSEVLYPLLVEGEIKSAMGFRKERGEWVPTSLGAPSDLKVAEPVRDKHGKAKGLGHASYFIARVPAMYLSFLGYWERNQMFLIPILENDLFPSLEPGKEMPAEDVLWSLHGKAARFEGGIAGEPPKE